MTIIYPQPSRKSIAIQGKLALIIENYQTLYKNLNLQLRTYDYLQLLDRPHEKRSFQEGKIKGG